MISKLIIPCIIHDSFAVSRNAHNTGNILNILNVIIMKLKQLPVEEWPQQYKILDKEMDGYDSWETKRALYLSAENIPGHFLLFQYDNLKADFGLFVLVEDQTYDVMVLDKSGAWQTTAYYFPLKGAEEIARAYQAKGNACLIMPNK